MTVLARVAGIVLAISSTCGMVAAQTAPPAAAQRAVAQPVPAPAGAAAPSTYRIGPGDLLMVSVFGVPELSQSSRVSNSGRIHVSKLGIIKVAGLTVSELEQDVAARLREKGLLLDPWVTVRVSEVRAHPVYALGEVMMPGQYQISTEMFLSDLVTLAQGVNEVSSPVAFLYRRKVNPATGESDPSTDADNDQMEAIPIDLRALQTGANPDLNVKLRGGDILYVPERKKEYYFVIGAVNLPGLFEIEPGQGPLRLSQALAKAGGPSRTAKASKTIVVRYPPDGKRQELAVDFTAVMRGRQQDLTVQFGDVIFVPGSRMKTAGAAMVGVIPGVVQGRATQR